MTHILPTLSESQQMQSLTMPLICPIKPLWTQINTFNLVGSTPTKSSIFVGEIAGSTTRKQSFSVANVSVLFAMTGLVKIKLRSLINTIGKGMNSMHLTVCFYKNTKAASKQGIWVISVANTKMVISIVLVKPAFIHQWHYSTVCSVELILGLKGTLKYIDTWSEINTWLREKRQEDESSECTACLQNEFKLWGKNKIQPILLKGIHVSPTYGLEFCALPHILTASMYLQP